MKINSPSLEEVQDDSVSPITYTVAATKKETAFSEKNSNYYNITDDVLSKFIYYQNFNTLSIKPFSIIDVRKIFRARVLEKLEPIVEVISACIDTDKSALDLTVPDFWALMYWERMNSYKKTNQWEVRFNCSSDKHLNMVAAGEASPESFNQVKRITSKSDLTITFIDEKAVIDTIARVHAEYGIFLDAPRMRDQLESHTLVSVLERVEDQLDLFWILRIACHLNPIHGETLVDRMDFIEKADLSPDLLEEIDKFEKLNKYGISEKIHTTCEVCGAKEVIDLTLDALTFFPENS